MICPSCGGEYADWVHKCPYCGSVNEDVDEQLYMQHLEEIKDRLDVADEEAGELYKKNVSSSVKGMVRILCICGAIAVGIFIVGLAISHAVSSREESREISQRAWEKEEFPKLDEWYEAGEYDEIIDEGYSLIEENSKFDIYDWEHYSFIFDYYSCYNQMCLSRDVFLETYGADDTGVAAFYEADAEIDTYVVCDILYNAFYFKMNAEDVRLSNMRKNYDSGNYGISEEELEKIKEYETEIEETLEKCFGWDESEIEEYYGKCIDSEAEIISYDLCDKLAEELF